jgi:uncharacterized membrane protein YphA (DoxX/SURF4 family)
MGLAIFVGFDLPIESLHTTGALMPYKKIVFTCLGLLLLIIALRRTVRRWMGMNLVLKTSRFKWNEEAGSERLKRITVYTLMEGVVFLSVAIGLYVVTPYAWLPAVAFATVFLDNIIFLVVGRWKKGFRVGITPKAVIMADRDVQLVYFSGLRKVSIHQDSVYFDYINDLQLNFPIDAIDPQKRDVFFDHLNAQLDRDRVFVTTKRS